MMKGFSSIRFDVRFLGISGLGLVCLLALALTAGARPQSPAPTPSLTPAAPAAPLATPAPTPSPAPAFQEACKDGLDTVPCLVFIWEHYGWWALVLFVIGAVIWIVIKSAATEGGKNIWGWFGQRFWRKPKPMTLEARKNEEDDYIQNLTQSLTPLEQIDLYLKWLKSSAELNRPPEEASFVPLEIGFPQEGDLQSLLSLETRTPTGQGQEALFREQKRFKSLQEAFTELDADGRPYPAFALLGEPGSGKSTLLRQMVRAAVRNYAADPAAPLPIFVSLNSHRRGTPLGFLRDCWQKAIGGDGQAVESALTEGRLWLFADSLNEMDRQNYQARLSFWKEFLRAHFGPGAARSGGNRAIIACRERDYGEGLDLPRLRVHPMDDARIQDFLRKRIPARAQAVWKDIDDDRRSGRGDLYRLAQTPFWLEMMARSAGSQGLPRKRAELMKRFVDDWLDYDAVRPGGCCLDEAGKAAYLDALTRLGWRGLPKGQNYTFPAEEAQACLRDSSAPTSPAETVLRLGRDCGLLDWNESSGEVRFQHQLFQEYFAARQLMASFKNGARLAQLWRIPWREWKFVRSRWDPLPEPPSTHWEEATILATGMLPVDQAERLALAVLALNPPLAARCAIESGVKFSAGVREQIELRLRGQLDDPRQRLAARLEAGKQLGRLGDERLLAWQGQVVITGGKPVAFIEPDWVTAPAISLRMGSSRGDRFRALLARAETYADEQPAHIVALSAFQIGRYPVTVAEYRCFIDAGGYQNEAYWPDAARRWLRGEVAFEESHQAFLYKQAHEQDQQLLAQVDVWVRSGSWSPAQGSGFRRFMEMDEAQVRQRWQDLESQKRDASGHAVRPWLWDDPKYTLPNQPVIGVCWYEAQAYALWLTEVLRAASRISLTQSARLPSEAEWERAARGTDGRLWPWGGRWDEGHCNSLEGRVMYPSPVGVYPQGRSPLGCADMAGNVWEWCQDWYTDDEYVRRTQAGQPVVDPPGPQTDEARVVRGGAWNYDRDYARCAYRLRYEPDIFYDDLGFRLALSPIKHLVS